MSRKKVIAGTAVIVILTAAVIAFFSFTTKAERRFGVSIPKTSSADNLGLVYEVRSDLIINIPEDHIRELGKSCHTYEEVVEELGEPSGMFGSGIVRAYWRIGEKKYAEYRFLGETSALDIIEIGE